MINFFNCWNCFPAFLFLPRKILCILL